MPKITFRNAQNEFEKIMKNRIFCSLSFRRAKTLKMGNFEASLIASDWEYEIKWIKISTTVLKKFLQVLFSVTYK